MALLRCYSEWADTSYSTQWCYENYVQIRSMNKARDIREQLEGLCERVEVEILSCAMDCETICKAMCSGYYSPDPHFTSSPLPPPPLSLS